MRVGSYDSNTRAWDSIIVVFNFALDNDRSKPRYFSRLLVDAFKMSQRTIQAQGISDLSALRRALDQGYSVAKKKAKITLRACHSNQLALLWVVATFMDSWLTIAGWSTSV